MIGRVSKKLILKRLISTLLPLIGIGIVFLLWFVIAKAIDMEILLPTPKQTFSELGKVMANADFYKSLGMTVLRGLLSFIAAFLVAAVCAVLSKLNYVIKGVFSPLISITRSMPTMSIILLALIWLTSAYAPLLISFIVIFPTLYSGIFSAIDGVDDGLLQMSKVFKVRKSDMVFRMVIPEILPSVLICSASSFSLNLKLVIASEALAQTASSLGGLMQISKAYLETATLLAYTVVAILLGLISELVIALLKQKLVRWKNDKV